MSKIFIYNYPLVVKDEGDLLTGVCVAGNWEAVVNHCIRNPGLKLTYSINLASPFLLYLYEFCGFGLIYRLLDDLKETSGKNIYIVLCQ